MARCSLTGSLPEDHGAGFAVIAARSVLKNWTESRIHHAIQSIDIAVEDWKRENDVTGLNAVVIDTIDVLFAIEWDKNVAPIVKGVSINECVALAILEEAEERPYVATKGGAFLAAFTIGNVEIIREIYESEWLPHIEVGVKVRRGGSKGHERAYGSANEKNQRRRDHCEAYDRARKGTKLKSQAKLTASKECDVSVKTIERSLKMRRERKI